MSEGIWDQRADGQKKGDSIREVIPKESLKDDWGFTEYVFSATMFNNPWYNIPTDDFELFENFVMGGSRMYPSDGSIPCDVVAKEARKVLNVLSSCSEDPNHTYCKEAQDALKYGKKSLVRGTLKLYLGKYTTRDWRRKRFTDDIDFWTFQVNLLNYSLKNCGFIKNKETGEWEKSVKWQDPFTNQERHQELSAANNLNQILDFGAGSFLEGSNLKDIFSKKIKRGHDVDISDMINVAIVMNGKNNDSEREWQQAIEALEEGANTRSTRTTSNLISLVRYSLGISQHLMRVAKVLEKYNDLILDEKKYSDEKIKEIGKISIHWQEYLEANGPIKTRALIHDFYHEQVEEKSQQAMNLKNFAREILDILNSKYKHLKVKFNVIIK